MVPIGKRKERGHMADKDTAAVNLRPPIFQVIDHCPAHIRDKRQFHGLPCFRLGKTEFFLRPVKVFKAQVFNVRAAQTQAARDQDDGIVTSAFRTPPINGPDQLLQFFMGPDRGWQSASWLLPWAFLLQSHPARYLPGTGNGKRHAGNRYAAPPFCRKNLPVS